MLTIAKGKPPHFFKMEFYTSSNSSFGNLSSEPNILLKNSSLDVASDSRCILYIQSWRREQHVLATSSFLVVTITLLPLLLSGNAHLMLSQDDMDHMSSRIITYLEKTNENIREYDKLNILINPVRSQIEKDGAANKVRRKLGAG